ncbi:hypothetical protein CV016_14480 [Yersinia kristensenii]|nr:hypothetical protein CV016_14480 [Yersinia kristensenii]
MPNQEPFRLLTKLIEEEIFRWGRSRLRDRSALGAAAPSHTGFAARFVINLKAPLGAFRLLFD